MFKSSQVFMLLLISILFWVIATIYIRYFPAAFIDPVRGAISFVTTLPVAWASILLSRRLARLTNSQLLPGMCVIGAIAMMIDALVLRWAPQVYGTDNAVLRNGAAWLLWGYGVSLAITLYLSARKEEARTTVDTQIKHI